MTKKQCCPKFNPKKWDQKVYHWKKLPFIRESMPTFFHTPFPPMIGKKMIKMMKMVEDAKAGLPLQDWLVLFHDPHAFKSEILMQVKKPINGADNVNLTGTFMSKVFDGPYSDIRKFFKEFDLYIESKGKKAKDYYVHYTYCPECAKKYGHNYMIFFAEV